MKRAASLKQRRNSSTGPITTYEAQRISDHRSTYGKQGKLRSFWRRVQTHQKHKLQHLEYMAEFIRERATLQKTFASSMIKLTQSTSLQPVPKPQLTLDVACNELLSAEKTSAQWIGIAADTIIKEVCDKGFDLTARNFRSTCAKFGKRAVKVSKKIDESHAHVLKCHRSYQNCFQSISQERSNSSNATSSSTSTSTSTTSSTTNEAASALADAAALTAHAKSRESNGGAQSSCLWTVETLYTRACTMYEMYCNEYRNEMSQLYIEYQKLELDRVTKMQLFMTQYLKSIGEGFTSVGTDPNCLAAMTATAELEPQREVVAGLNMLNSLSEGEKGQDGERKTASQTKAKAKTTTKTKTSTATKTPTTATNNDADTTSSTSSTSASNSSTHSSPPSPLQSKLVLKSGTLLIKSGLLRSWKPHHSVLTADGYLHIFDPSSLLEQGSSDKKSPPTYEPYLSIDIIASTAKTTGDYNTAFDVTTSTKGFLGIMNSQRVQSFRTEREDLVKAWIDAFGRIRRLISSEINSKR